MVSIDEVARLAGVSTATVSRALSGRGTVSARTRDRVEEAASALGYVVSSTASSLASGRMRNIGIVVPFLDRWFFSTVVSGASSELAHRGYDVTLYNITADEGVRRAIFEEFVRRRRIDGLIVVAIDLSEHESRRLDELGIPVIAIGGPHALLPTLEVDEVAIARTAVEHLLSLGHRDIAHIGAVPEHDREFHVPSQRREGLDRALRAEGLAADPASFAPSDFTIEGGYRAAMRLLDRPHHRPTAIFAASDEMAIGAVLAARELGLAIPGDVSIIGVDGHELGAFFDLTTIDQQPEAQGQRAVEVLLAGIEGTAPPEVSVTTLPFHLVVRGSTAPPPA